MFPHEDLDFDALLLIVAEARGISVALVEKDYWVTHTLWALQQAGLEIWFKGGTSLSKGFGVIERFSEDLDLKLGPGTSRVPEVDDWHRNSTRAKRGRKEFFEALDGVLTVPGARIEREEADEGWLAANYRVLYPGEHLGELNPLRPYVLLEVGDARVTPFVERDIQSFVHQWLEEHNRLSEFDSNLPRGIRCLHPYVTLIEKLESLHRQVRNGRDPAAYVRHFEDVAAIIRHEAELPPLPGYADVHALAEEMFAKHDIVWRPDASDPAFNRDSNAPWPGIDAAYAEVTGMYWSPEARLPLDEALTVIRGWIAKRLPL